MFNAHFTFSDNRKMQKVINALEELKLYDVVAMFDNSDEMCTRLLNIYNYAKQEEISLQDACIFALLG